MDNVSYTPIGVICTPFQSIEDMPIQPSGAASVVGDVIVAPAYSAGLDDIEGFSHIMLIYHFHRSKGFDLTVTPFLDDHLRGLFATRAPRRPNAIGLSVVALLGRDKNVLRIGGIDVLDQTPLLDIKPFVSAFDAPDGSVAGWLEKKAEKSRTIRSDGRFGKK